MRAFAIGTLAAALTLSTAAGAAEAYLYDAMKTPAYRKAWTTLVRNEAKLPTWLRQVTGRQDYVATPETAATVDGVAFRLFHACKAHDCGGNEFEVMFAPDAAHAWGMLIDANKPPRYLGAPNAAQKAALAKAMAQ